jgi:plasmid maintenance system killer protein
MLILAYLEASVKGLCALRLNSDWRLVASLEHWLFEASGDLFTLVIFCGTERLGL